MLLYTVEEVRSVGVKVAEDKQLQREITLISDPCSPWSAASWRIVKIRELLELPTHQARPALFGGTARWPSEALNKQRQRHITRR